MTAAPCSAGSRRALPEEREQAWYDLTRGVLQQFDAEMQARIRGTLGAYVR
jgi:hypothetical protein